MWGPLRSLRVRLVLTFVLVVGIINAILGGVGIGLREWQLRSRFDERLALRTDRLAAWLQPRLEVAGEAEALLNHPGRPFGEEELWVALQGAAGETIAKTPNWGAGAVPGAVLPGAGELPAFRTLDGEEVEGLRGRPHRVRVYSRAVRTGGGEYVLRVGRDLAEVDEPLAYLRNVLWFAMPTALIVAGLAGWVVINGAIRALRTVSQTASHIHPGHLDERIRVSTGDAEITRAVTELNHMLDRLSTSFKAQQRFITSASHALQTPVAALLSQAQLLQGEATTDADCRRFVASVEEEMRQMTRMLAAMLSVIRVESGELQRSQSVLSLNDTMVSAVESVRTVASTKGVRVQLTLPDPEQAADPDVLGDSGLLQTMVENLLRGAVQASPAGGVVDAALDIDVDQVVVTVSDSGPALPDHAIRSIFDRAGPEASGRPVDRQSLGLAMAKTIAELHDGTIGVRNGSESGVAFFVYLPLAKRAAG